VTQLPSVREELDRKTVETLDWLMAAVRNGLLTDSQFSTGIAATWKAVSGLVSEDVSELMCEAGRIAREKPPMERRFFWKKEPMVVERQMQESSFYVSKPLRGFRSHGGCASPAHAKEMMDSFCTRLIENGWREL
jgi:hypothetical protein